ncbi:MAG: helix-turn-helix domain-containing protein [Clostridiales bacterium]|nr:helix-turn-helix domain-containing protein [Clostridiales bacterium]
MYIYKEEHFGTIERILEWQNQRNISTDDLAALFEVNERTIRRWKKGTPIRRSNLERIAQVMDVDLEYLECKQNTPRRRESHKMKLFDQLSAGEKYLPRIAKLVERTPQRFIFSGGYDLDNVEIIDGSFIDGDTRYYYEDAAPTYTGERYYNICINGSEPIRLECSEIDDFVNGIMKFICYQIEQLKDGRQS